MTRYDTAHIAYTHEEPLPGDTGANDRSGLEIAIIGMAGRFPGAANIDEFWKNLEKGVESLVFTTDEELSEAGLNPELLKNPNFVKTRGGVLDKKEYFDADFFGYSPNEAELMNPQMRIFHECAWEALENAGYAPGVFDGPIGLYAGASGSFHWQGLVFVTDMKNVLSAFETYQLTDRDFLSTRISYKLDLKGPSFMVQTACSTSLAAVHLACQALLNGECDMALAGGVTVRSEAGQGYLYEEGMIMSPDGHCRAFDAEAAGTVSGEGVGIVMLKPLEDALDQGDMIHAVIKGTAVNNDGFRKAGYTAPSIEGQADVIEMAHRMAGIEPESITYIETHGTGTPLGDSIEIEALRQAFNSENRHFCAIGSLKTNVGHLDNAAGIAGLIKTVLALEHRRIPPTLHFKTPNPKLDLEHSPFYVNTTLKEWQGNGNPLRAGVSAFGIGGTNVHVVLEEAPHIEEQKTGGSKYQLILLSARTPSALETMTQNLAHHFRQNPGINLADAAYTLQVGRRESRYRGALVCRDVEEAAIQLADPGSPITYHGECPGKDAPDVVFLFPGLGAQYPNMGWEIYQNEPVFRSEMNQCFEILANLVNDDIKEILYGPGGKHDSCGTRRAGELIHQIEIAQPILFIFEYALARMIMKWGIQPRAMIGYSFGEYTAACIADVLSVEDALKLLTARGQVLKKAPAGSMISVPLPKDQLIPLLPGNLSLCIDNGSACIVGGSPEAVSVFAEEMKARRNITVRLNTSHAVHSHLMDPIVPEFEKKLEGIHFKNPKIPYISNVTGEWMTPGAAVDSRYWARHLRQPVRFAEGIRTLAGQPNPVFIEIGPGRDLTTLVARYIEPNKIVNLVRPAEIDSHDIYYLLNKIGKLWKTGVSIHWPAFYGEETRRRIPLPTYPFERQRYWIADKLLTPGRKQLKKTTAPGESKNLADWFYIPTWKPSESLVSAWSAVPPSGRVKNNDRWLVFLDFTGLGDLLVKRLKEKNSDVVTVTAGTEFQLMGDNGYMINPASPEDYRRMFNALETLGFVPNRVLHMWNLTANPVDPGHAAQYLEREAFEKAQELGVYSLLHIAGAIGQQDPRRQFLVDIISSNVHDITGDEIIHPGKATLVGPLKVLPQEYANIRCRSIDVRIPGDGGENANRAREILVEQLTEELLINSEMESFETEVAFRGRHRWLRTFERLSLEEPPPERLRLRKKGIYLITGGLGEIGLTLAELLVESVGAQLILTGRSALSTRKQWQDDKIKKLEAHGAGVWMIEADVADFERMQTIITEVEQQWGAINGVIHAAGIIAPGTFHAVKDMKPGDEDTRRHFHPKVYGTLTLEKLFREKSLDFCLLISSISTVLGGLGFTAYAAANSFMDGFVQPFKRNPSSPGPWISVNWDGMDPENTKNAFKRIFSLSPNINRLVVSRGGKLHSHIDRWVKQAGTWEQPTSAQHQSRPSLMNPYVPPSSPIEKSIAEIFQKMFGYNPIGIQDDFFELGLDSIKALQIRARMINIGYHVQLEDFFNFPTISALVPRIGILENNRQTVDPGPIKIPSGTMEKIQNIFPDQVQDVYPLTPMQEGMLFYSLYDNLNTDNLNTKIQAYFEQICYRVHQELDVSLIEQSVNELIKRHDILRTAFVHENLEQPMQVVLKERSAAFVYRDLRRISNGQPGEKEAYINQYIEKDKRQPFNLSKDVLIRVSVIQVDDAEYLLIWSFHHALMDGWSMGILTADYFTIYNSFLTGKPQQLQAAPYFRSYIGWLAKQDKALALRTWKNYLWGYDEIAAIPRKRSIINKDVKMQEVYLPGGIGKILDKDYTRRLQEISVRRRVTLSAVFHALWAILLGKYSGKQDVVFGSVVSGRPSTLIGVENMVGCFINTIPVRVQFDYHTPFHHLVRTVRENALKLEPFHYFSLAEIQSQTILKQNLLDHFIEFQNFPMARQIENVGEQIAQETPAMSQKLSHIRAFEQGNYDFILDIEPGEQVGLNFGYNAHIYDNDLMIRLGTHALNVLEQILDDDEILIGKIEFLSEAEKQQILCEFNTTEDFATGGTVFQWLERHAQDTPDRPAFVFGEFWVTYGALNARVLQIAIMLKNRGVRGESIVGILSERSPLMAVCILGVWRAGGAYIPLD
ncbi:MAG TPA: SDR family NAD(P)-dependent oxidoreductase, partial [Candidatus Deferrimicrobium sp.]|nr:SDR family NAD(P)-dependent oxidoreductase [Candidatus Deferrimicrobium sp.]